MSDVTDGRSNTFKSLIMCTRLVNYVDIGTVVLFSFFSYFGGGGGDRTLSVTWQNLAVLRISDYRC